MPTVNVNIQPAIINWALSQTSEEKLGVKLMESIKHWLDGTKSPTFSQIEDFSIFLNAGKKMQMMTFIKK